MLGTRAFSGKLTFVVPCSLMVSVPLLGLPEVAFDHSTNSFAAVTFPWVLLTQKKMQEATHHPYQVGTSPDTDASFFHFFQFISLMTQSPFTVSHPGIIPLHFPLARGHAVTCAIHQASRQLP